MQVVEWLRRWLENLLVTLRAGSIPGAGDFFFNNDDGGASHSVASAKYKAQGSEATENANAKPEGMKQPRMQARSAKPEGAKRLS